MPDIVCKFGALELLDEAQSWQESGDSRITVAQVAKRHGLYIADVPVMDGKYVNMTGTIIAASPGAARDRLDVFTAEINKGKQKLKLFDDRFLVAIKTKFNWVPVGDGSTLRWELQLLADNPFLFSENESEDIEVIATSPQQWSVDNDGTAFLYPVIKFAADQGGPITAVLMENETTGKSMTYTGTVAEGDTLEIDCGNYYVLNNGAEDLTNWSGVFLWLDVGTNNLKFTGSLCTITIEWRIRYWS